MMALPFAAPTLLSPQAGPPPAPTPAPVRIGPDDAHWARVGGKPPMPVNYDEIIAQAKAERDDHAGRIAQTEEMLEWLAQKRRAYFKRHAEKIESGEIELGSVTDLVDEQAALVAFVAGMQLSFTAKYRQAIDQEEAAAKEDFLHYLVECWEDDHHASGYGNLRQDLPAIYSICAMLATFVLYDPRNEELGLKLRMVNPLTVFPIWEGGRGLAQIYRVYQASAANVIGDFDTPEGEVAAVVAEQARDDSFTQGYDPSYTDEVIEYWDRNWGCVTFGGKVCRVWEHGRGKVPWVITPGTFGPPHLVDTSVATFSLADGRMIEAFTQGRATRHENLRLQYQPFLWRRLPAHIQEERFAGIYNTLLRRSINPALVYKQSATTAALGDPPISTDEAAKNKIGADDDLSPLEGVPLAEVFQPLQGILDRNRQTGMANSMLLGQMSASSSGTAIDIAAQNGNRSWSPVIHGVQAHLREVGEEALENILLFGDVLGPLNERGAPAGMIPVPRRLPLKTGQSPAHEVTPDLIRQTGTRLSVELYSFDPATLGPTGNGLAIAASQGWVDKRSAIRILGYTPDVEGVIQRIKDDQLDEVPEIQMADTIEYLHKQAEAAAERGDWESARKLAARVFYVTSMMQAKLMMMPGLANQLGNPGTAEQQMMPGTPPPPEQMESNIQFQGASMPQYGGETGTDGGRPVGPNETLSGGVPPPRQPVAQG